MRIKLAAALSLMLMLSACGDTRPTDVGGLTPSENEALNDAAAALDEADAQMMDGVKKP